MPETKHVIIESFSWLTPEAFSLEDVGQNKVRIKGVALKSNTISRNRRKYMDEELIKSARTLIGKPITINHDMGKIVGNVEWAEYENGALEYYGIVKKQPFVGLLRSRNEDIKGVSVEAAYLHNKCPICGERFYTEDSFVSHMGTSHHVKEGITQPHGINFTALSLVVSPEVPGVKDTTIDLMETFKPLSQLSETVTTYRQEQEEWRNKMAKVATVTPRKRITVSEAKKLREQQPRTDEERAKAHFNISDEEWDKLSPEQKQDYIDKLPERGAAKEQEEHTCPEGEHWSDEENKCVPHKVEEQTQQELHAYPKLRNRRKLKSRRSRSFLNHTLSQPPNAPTDSFMTKRLEPACLKSGLNKRQQCQRPKSCLSQQ